MKYLFSILIGVATFQSAFCQTTAGISKSQDKLEQFLWSFSKNKLTSEKPLIDFEAINNWRTLGWYLAVSNDGKYFAYTINKRTATPTWFPRVDSLVIQSTTNGWRTAVAVGKEGFFTEDNRQYIFQNGEQLCFLQLGTEQFVSIKNVSAYKPSAKKNWLAYKCKNSDTLALLSLATGTEQRFPNITGYSFDDSGEWLVGQTASKELLICNLATKATKQYANLAAYSFSKNAKALLLKSTTETGSSLQYMSLPQGAPVTVFTANGKVTIGSYAMDETGDQLVFYVVDSTDNNKTGIWYYKAGTDKAVLKLNNSAIDITGGLTIGDAVTLTDNGKYIRLSLQTSPVEVAKPNEEFAGLELWSHSDVYLQSTQSKHVNDVAGYNAIAHMESGKIVFLESANKKLAGLKGNFALVKSDYSELQGDRFWQRDLHKDSSWIVSLKDGTSHLVPASRNSLFWFSPDGNWLIYFDPQKGCHYYSYNLLTRDVKNISAGVADNQLGFLDQSEKSGRTPGQGNLAAWMSNEPFVLVYDNYDIWKLDLAGKKPAVNITNGYGQTNGVVFNMFSTDHFSGDVPVVKSNEPLLLRGFNTRNKQNGFYKKVNCNARIPSALSLGDYFMSLITGCHDANLSNFGMSPVKAKDKGIWIVQRQSTNDALIIMKQETSKLSEGSPTTNRNHHTAG